MNDDVAGDGYVDRRMEASTRAVNQGLQRRGSLGSRQVKVGGEDAGVGLLIGARLTEQ